MLRDVYTALIDKPRPAFADHIADVGKTIQKSQMAANRCFNADRGQNPTFWAFLPFSGEKSVYRKLCEARSHSGAYVYTGKEFLRERRVGWMMLG